MHLFYVKITPNFDLFSVLITFKNKTIKKQCAPEEISGQVFLSFFCKYSDIDKK